MPRQRSLEEFGASTDPAPPRPPSLGRPHPPPLPHIWEVDSDGFLLHPFLQPRTLRALPFQVELARQALTENLLVVLPTGLGKTVIAALVAAEILRRTDYRVLVLAPTRPLVQQHAHSFGAWLAGVRIARFTGTVQRPVRQGNWETCDLLFATPEIVRNDIAAGRYDLADVGFVVFDECHHAVGKYAYVGIAERYLVDGPDDRRILGLTASPGGRDEHIEEVVEHLGRPHVEARSREDEGVREFVQPIDVEYLWVELPEATREVRDRLANAARTTARKLQKMGYLRTKPIDALGVKDLVQLRAEIFARPGPMVRKFGPLFHQLILLHLHQMQERVETQGLRPFLAYLDRLAAKERPSRGDRALLTHPEVIAARQAAEAALGRGGVEGSHPKLDALIEVVREEMERPRERPPRILVFAQYRDTIDTIRSAMEQHGWAAGRFVGQSTRSDQDRGMTQREQARVLQGFRQGAFPILVGSSVAEEGLDVPDVDLVVFFESVASEIRAIQRRGRTGRSSVGRVMILLTEDTRDVGHQRAEARRERSMRRIVRKLSRARKSPAPPPDSDGEPQTPSRQDARAGFAGDKPGDLPPSTRLGRRP
jgi:ERCC4-related helicase